MVPGFTLSFYTMVSSFLNYILWFVYLTDLFLPSDFSVGTPGSYFSWVISSLECLSVDLYTEWQFDYNTHGSNCLLLKTGRHCSIFFGIQSSCTKVWSFLYFSPSYSWSLFFLLRSLGNFLQCWIWKRNRLCLINSFIFFHFCLNARYSLHV